MTDLEKVDEAENGLPILGKQSPASTVIVGPAPGPYQRWEEATEADDA